MSELIALVAALMVFVGSAIFLAGAIGFVRLPDFYTAMHAPTKAATLGLPLMALASTLVNAGSGSSVWMEDLLLVIFVLITVPISTQILLWAAICRKLPATPETRGQPRDMSSPSGLK